MPSFTCVTHRFLKLTVKGHKGSACKRDYLAHKGTDRGCSTDTQRQEKSRMSPF